VRVPSVMDSPIWGMTTSVDIGNPSTRESICATFGGATLQIIVP
jgi:hypothetical protein